MLPNFANVTQFWQCDPILAMLPNFGYVFFCDTTPYLLKVEYALAEDETLLGGLKNADKLLTVLMDC